jgi:hypothetical protein
MGLTRAEIEQRVEQDTGAGDDIVWVKRSKGGTRSAYHNYQDCRGLRGVTDQRSFERRHAQRRLFAPCRWCVLDDADNE